MINCRNKVLGRDCKVDDNINISCESLILGDEVVIESGADIYLHGKLEIGSLSTIGRNTVMRGNNVHIGSEFYNDGGLTIGGGGWRNPGANLFIGDRCVIHDSHININCPISIGNHVGLSNGVDLITHGYWLSVLKGYPFKEGPIVIKDNVIVGWRALILPGVTIGANATIAAGSVVTKDVSEYEVSGGVPARTLDRVKPDRLPVDEKKRFSEKLIKEYEELLAFRGISHSPVILKYPIVTVDGATFDLEKETCHIKNHTALTDDFRDFIRRKGIWFYGRRFKSIEKVPPTSGGG